MSIVVNLHGNKSADVFVPENHYVEFKELIQRGVNLWPDASPAIKEFADKLTNDGWVMQDYSKAAVTSQAAPKIA